MDGSTLPNQREVNLAQRVDEVEEFLFNQLEKVMSRIDFESKSQIELLHEIAESTDRYFSDCRSILILLSRMFNLASSCQDCRYDRAKMRLSQRSKQGHIEFHTYEKLWDLDDFEDNPIYFIVCFPVRLFIRACKGHVKSNRVKLYPRWSEEEFRLHWARIVNSKPYIGLERPQ
jgi:hypothetical protein